MNADYSGPKTPEITEPRPEVDTLVVQRDLETVVAALLNHVEDSQAWPSPRLQPVDSPSIQIRKYEVVAGVMWPGRDEQTVLRDDWLRLGTIRLTGIQDDATEVMIRREYWETNEQQGYLITEGHRELFGRFFDEFIDLLVRRYGAMGEGEINPDRPSVEKRTPLVDHHTSATISIPQEGTLEKVALALYLHEVQKLSWTDCYHYADTCNHTRDKYRNASGVRFHLKTLRTQWPDRILNFVDREDAIRKMKSTLGL
jgi:hypothetical protein